MKKYLKNLLVKSIEKPREDYIIIRLTQQDSLPPIEAGQFVEIRVENAPNTYLRRPISVNFVDYQQQELWLLVHGVGEGTQKMCELQTGDMVDCLYPLGKGFSLPNKGKYLLIGGGVGTAPLLYQGFLLREKQVDVTFLLGGRSQKDLLQLEEFKKYGRVCTTTEDGSQGTQGFVTQHEVLQEEFDGIFCCGPQPMMKAVAHFAKERNLFCEVSLENLMACGLGACLCCVEKTTTGNRCVCQDGPVFNINELIW